MQIYVVRSGDTLNRIARQTGVPVERIIRDNRLDPAQTLVPGQTLVLLTPSVAYTVQPGDTLAGIAAAYDTSVNALLRDNIWLRGLPVLSPGQELAIAYDQPKEGSMAVNGYIYPYVDRDVLRETLPYLTYLTIFTYGFTPEGELIGIDDDELIAIIKEYGVAPLMLIAPETEEGSFSTELASSMLNNEAAKSRLIDNLLATAQAKGYYGLDVDFEFISPEDRDLYTDFVRRLTERFNAVGMPVTVTLAPKISSDQPGLLYQGHDYGGLGAAANAVLLMTYEWGYTYGPPMAVAPLNKVKEVLDYAVTQIPADKINMGIPNYGYDWTLPFVKGESEADTISNVEAVDIARQAGAVIQFDGLAQSPYFQYYDEQWRQHEVWFEDARSIRAKLEQVPAYGFMGVGYWQLMKFFPQNWLVLNALYDIEKVL